MFVESHPEIAGNVTDEMKVLSAKTLAEFIGTKATSYGAEIGKNLRLAEINVWDREDSTKEAQTVCEIEVTSGWSWILHACAIGGTSKMLATDMCNIFGTLHGGCAAYLIDP